MRFINHAGSKSKSLNIGCRYLKYKGTRTVIFTAHKNIKKGQELFIDYGKEFFMDVDESSEKE
jgi:SET domain-containing protein